LKNGLLSIGGLNAGLVSTGGLKTTLVNTGVLKSAGSYNTGPITSGNLKAITGRFVDVSPYSDIYPSPSYTGRLKTEIVSARGLKRGLISNGDLKVATGNLVGVPSYSDYYPSPSYTGRLNTKFVSARGLKSGLVSRGDFKIATGNFVGVPLYSDRYPSPNLPAISYLTPSVSIPVLPLGGESIVAKNSAISVAKGGLIGLSNGITLAGRSGKVEYVY
jgi:hypothetical protein